METSFQQPISSVPRCLQVVVKRTGHDTHTKHVPVTIFETCCCHQIRNKPVCFHKTVKGINLSIFYVFYVQLWVENANRCIVFFWESGVYRSTQSWLSKIFSHFHLIIYLCGNEVVVRVGLFQHGQQTL